MFSGRPSSWLGVSRMTWPTLVSRVSSRVSSGGRFAVMAPVSTKILPLPEKRPERVTLPASTLASRVPTMRSRSATSPEPTSSSTCPVSVLTSSMTKSPCGAATFTSLPALRTVTSPASARTFTSPERPLSSTSPALDSTSTAPPAGTLSAKSAPVPRPPSVSRTKVESWRERSTGTSEAALLAAAGSGPMAYLVTSYSTESSPSTPSTRTCPAPLVRRTRGSGPESMESRATLVPERLSPRDLHRSRPATARSARSRAAKSRRRGEGRDRPSRRSPLAGNEAPGVSPGSRRGSPSPLRLTRRSRGGRAEGRSRPRAAVDVVEADYVVLVELAEGDFQYARLPLSDRREPVHRLPWDEELLPGLGVEDLSVQLDAGARVEHHPQLVALVVVLAREDAARDDRDDLDRGGQVVGVLLEPAPGPLYLDRRRPMIQTQPPYSCAGEV